MLYTWLNKNRLINKTTATTTAVVVTIVTILHPLAYVVIIKKYM